MGYIGYRIVNGKKEYCLYDDKRQSQILSGHPARFSPEDTFSKYRIELKTSAEMIPK